ncbi:MAG: aminotransferase class I/II-fold pyridoxal phosphate-dependent enzyme [Candidatus Hydrogenedentota bacterium]|nr:MAG: aminotransferase class I/II-fold pyridoxal phosphate-dependent enzyme [Candidatus Hydrogenedentota bacterium]
MKRRKKSRKTNHSEKPSPPRRAKTFSLITVQNASHERKSPLETARTLSVHAGETAEVLGDSVVTPVFQTATYCFRKSAEVRAYHEAEVKSRFEYGRYGSPTQLTLERKLAELFGTEDALVTSSGMAAVTDTLLTLLSSGDHVVMTSECYRRTRAFSEKFLSKFGVRVDFVSPRADDVIRALGRRTKAVFLEIPTNPHLYVPDIEVVAEKCRKRNIPLLVDPTIAAPFNCDPVGLGADLVILSLTKYLAGHNDIIGGAVLGPRALVDRVREYHGTVGTLLPPLAAYLILRGIKTAALRVRAQNESALAIAHFLQTHPKVQRVFYPGLPSHPDHEIARKAMNGFGCVVSFEIQTDLAGAERFVDSLRLFKIGPSLGGVESLAEIVATMSFWDKSRRERKRLGIGDNLVRLSIGIEDAADLVRDLNKALRKV